MEKMEFQRTQNPSLHALIPLKSPDARVVAHQRMPRLRPGDEARKSEICRVREEKWGDRRAMVAHVGACVNDLPHLST
ncbi:hypothetical protein AVEN_132274-1 [Araneus ventricosus]|uniref:Uncharacterized protein n=1 Tax=Araneus ventricosus TaxID=182803 RepID=A0A4Y2JPP3_ARAVE|nr:hypothetical protein AVEN_132274-1 [Araneus ventricosus]